MAIAIDQASLGLTVRLAGNSTPIDVVTSGAVASGGFIVAILSWWWGSTNPTVTDATGGSLDWTLDSSDVAESGFRRAILSAQAPSGLASSTTITPTWGGTGEANDYRAMFVCSFTGVKTSSPVDTSQVGDEANDNSWTTNAMTHQAGSLLIGMSAFEAGNPAPTSTPTSPAVELYDNGVTDTASITAAYRIEASGGSNAVAGTWSASGSHRDLGVAYLAGSGDITVGPPAPAIALAVAPVPVLTARPFATVLVR
jgi:hypothetical protein